MTTEINAVCFLNLVLTFWGLTEKLQRFKMTKKENKH